MSEEWRKIKGFENYYVSNLGRVKNSKGKILKSRKERKNVEYIRVGLYKNGKLKNIPVHRLVALMFIPNPKNKPVVNHKNEIKHDNRVENLEWVTLKENQNYGTCIARRVEKYYKKVGQYSLDGKLIKIFNSIKEASEFYGITNSSIVQNLKGKTKKCVNSIWRYL